MRLLPIKKNFSNLETRYLYTLLLFFTFTSTSYSQLPDTCDEVIVRLIVEKLPQTDIASVICEDKVYVSLNELFDFTKVKSAFIDSNFKVLEGFLTNPNDFYTINAKQNEIIYKDKRFDLAEDDIIVVGNNMYLALSVLDRVFKFKTEFYFQELTIVTNSASELPAMKEARLLERRLNINKITNTTFVGDTLIRNKRPNADFGSFTYSYNSRQLVNGNSFNRLQLAAGGQLLGGDVQTNFISSTNNPVTLRNFSGRYRYVDNSLDNFKQLSLGFIGTNSIATLTAPIVGFQVTNRSTQLRKSFENFVVSEFTNPFWTVELYVNDVLIDYTQADETGFYTFTVPIIYGRTNIRLRFFGQFGEEQSTEQLINVPFNFLPPNEFEYQVTGGTLVGDSGSLFSQVVGSYGITNYLTVALGTEFIKRNENVSVIPFINTDVKIRNNLILAADYAYKTKFETSLSYFSTSNFNANIQYRELSESQNVVRIGATRQFSSLVSVPVRSNYVNGFARLRFDYRANRSGFNTTTSQLIFSGKTFGLTSSFTGSVLTSTISNDLYRLRGSTTFEIYRDFYMTPELLYELSLNQVNFARVRIRKRLYGRGQLDFSYTRTFFPQNNVFSLGLRWDFDVARTGAQIDITNDQVVIGANVFGGITFNPYDDSFNVDKNVTLGRANLSFVPYLDYNDNNRRDTDEPNAYGLAGRINKGRVGDLTKRGYLKFNNLEPYIDYYIELNTNQMESVAYKLDKTSYNITLSPNKITTVEVPVKVTGEVAGYVFRNKSGSYEPFSRIKVNILDEKFKTVATVLSEFDGYFSYLGLPSGNYTAQVDFNQLQKIFYSAKERIIPFTMDNSRQGEIIDNLEFYLEPHAPQFEIFEIIVKSLRY